MFSFLRQPYPLFDLSFVKAVFQSLLFGSFISFLLVVFQPFGAYNWHHPYKVLLLAGFGLAAAVSVLINFYGFKNTFPSLFNERQWTVGKEILWNLTSLIMGGFCSTIYGYLTGAMPLAFSQFVYMISVAFLVGLFPAIILVLSNYLYLSRKYTPDPLLESHKTPLTEEATPETITLLADNNKDTLLLLAHDLLFIEASDNYCTVVYQENGKITKTLVRSSLSRLESQIVSAHVQRCHRSYLVNLRQVHSVSGNAQGYKLHFLSGQGPVPVARSYTSLIKEQLQAG